jgi:HD-GYP domain-containing protein (c-di-GMP phosphodiesterase class II)
MRVVPIECIKEGSYLAKTIFDDDGRLLLREGVRLTENILKRIKTIKIYSLYIIDEYSNKEIEDIIKPELRQKAIRSLKETFSTMEKATTLSVRTGVQETRSSAMIKERESYFQSIGQLSLDLVDELLSRKNVLVNLVDIKSMDNYTYQHCVNVAVLSLILGIQLKLNKFELYDLCMGALVHDIGKILVPRNLILKPGSLSIDEFKTMKDHAVKGYNYLRTVYEISASARIVALQHHEHFNGEGYPEKRKGSEISKLARIVAIADVYDALTSDRPYRRALSPNEALEYIMGSGSRQFDYEMVLTFSKAVVPYPEGTLVKLSTEEYAVVEEVFENYPLRPKLKIVKSPNAVRVNSIVNLVTELDIVIQGLVHELPQ